MRLCVFAIATGLFAAQSHAQFAFNNYGGNGTQHGLGALGMQYAIRFVGPPAASHLVSVRSEFANAGDVEFSLRTDDGGPSQVIESHTIGVSASEWNIVGFSGRPEIAAGVFYWITARKADPDQVPYVLYWDTGNDAETQWGTRAANTPWSLHYGGHAPTIAVVVEPDCRGDFDLHDGRTVRDIFAFLACWFSLDPTADVDGGGIGVSDIFAFLTLWFAGCP